MAEMDSRALAERIAKLLDNRLATDIEVIRIEELTVVADYFVICTGNATTHVKALSDEVEFKLKTEDGIYPISINGYESANWILLDYGGVVVHIFLADTRAFYSLERLWGDAPRVEFDLKK